MPIFFKKLSPAARLIFTSMASLITTSDGHIWDMKNPRMLFENHRLVCIVVWKITGFIRIISLVISPGIFWRSCTSPGRFISQFVYISWRPRSYAPLPMDFFVGFSEVCGFRQQTHKPYPNIENWNWTLYQPLLNIFPKDYGGVYKVVTAIYWSDVPYVFPECPHYKLDKYFNTLQQKAWSIQNSNLALTLYQDLLGGTCWENG